MKLKVAMVQLALMLAIVATLALPAMAEKTAINFNVDFDEGFVIARPLYNSFEVNHSAVMAFHVYNKSNGAQIIDGIGCYLNVYDPDEQAVFIGTDYESGTSENYIYEFTLDENNLTKLGYYNFIVSCNNTNQGGFTEQMFMVTGDGQPVNEAKSLLTLGLLLSITLALALSAFLFAYFYAHTDPLNKFLKILFMAAALLSGISSVAVQTIGINKYEGFLKLSMSSTVVSSYSMVLWVFRIAIIAVIVWLIYAGAMNALGKKVDGPEKNG